MNFKERKECLQPIKDYLCECDCNMESLMGLKVGLQATLVAVENRMQKLVKARDKISKLTNRSDNSNPLDWMD